ncbi:MAG TPA: homoserine kinase [Gaiellaceae bacterium]
MRPERFVVRAPATTANLGPGFDCAGAALELWNELHVLPAEHGEPLVELDGEGTDEIPTDESHLALQAFALAAPLDGHRFRFVNRIPLERGLGSSAATVAAGLVAGLVAAGRELESDEVIELGLPLEGHADNLAPAILGGVCLSWKSDGGGHEARRIATGLPLTPIFVVPGSRVSTSESRTRLPGSLPHADAVSAAAQAALLGAAIASGDADLLTAAFRDFLHEPFRAPDAPLLGALREAPVTGQRGVTLSGSGPTVAVWVDPARVDEAEVELRQLAREAQIIPLAIAGRGTHGVLLEADENEATTTLGVHA